MNKAASRSRQCFAIIQWYLTLRNKDSLSLNCNHASSAFGVMFKKCEVLQPKQAKPFNSVLYQRMWLLPFSPSRATASNLTGGDVWKLHHLIRDRSRDDRSFSVAFSSSYPHPTSIFSSLHSSNILYLCFRSPKWSWNKIWLWKNNSDSQLSSTTPVYSTPLGSLKCAWPHLTCGSKQSCLCIGLKLLKIGHPI